MDRKKWNYDLIWTFACYLLFTGKICQPTFAEFTLFQWCSFESESSPWGWHVLDLPCLTANLTNIMLYTLTKKKGSLWFIVIVLLSCPWHYYWNFSLIAWHGRPISRSDYHGKLLKAATQSSWRLCHPIQSQGGRVWCSHEGHVHWTVVQQSWTSWRPYCCQYRSWEDDTQPSNRYDCIPVHQPARMKNFEFIG